MVRFVVVRGPGAAQFSSDPPGNHKFDPDSPENSWDPDPGLKNNTRIGSRSRHNPRASGAPGCCHVVLRKFRLWARSCVCAVDPHYTPEPRIADTHVRFPN